MKICVLTGYTPDIKAEGDYIAEHNRNYAIKHGYDFRAITDSRAFDVRRPATWSKVQFLKRTLPDFDWVFWIDSDALFMNWTIKLESLIEPGVISVNSKSWAGDVMCGTWLVKNEPLAQVMLDDAYRQVRYAASHRHEESGFGEVCANYPVKYVTQKTMNAFDFTQPGYKRFGFVPYPEGQFTPGTFILHLAKLKNRMALVKQYLSNDSCFIRG